MTYEPIQRVEIKHYGCIKEASFVLSPIHALIGPNDSGKSTALRALRTAAQFAAGKFEQDANRLFVLPFDPMLNAQARPSIVLSYADELEYVLWSDGGAVKETVKNRGRDVATSDAARAWNNLGVVMKGSGYATLRDRITTATMVRFDPNALRSPSPEILESEPVFFRDEMGTGLASVYHAILTRDVDAFVAIRDKVRSLFPTLQSILVPAIAKNVVAIRARLTDGTEVPAEAMSEGLLYLLGYMALRYLERSTLFLVEEPENGLHPSRIKDVMNVLREMSKESQIIIATHSPLVINELEANEVSVVTRPSLERGTSVVSIRETPNFEKRSSVYALGELWLSYADGEVEAPLLRGTEGEDTSGG